MATPAANKRLTKEFKNIQENPVPFILAKPDESNILRWHYIISGPPDTPFHGGEYHGTLQFPPDYPFNPPAIRMTTPSGRFQEKIRLCLSMSDYHPKDWNPTWSVSTILMGLLSFMVSDERTAGAINTTKDTKKMLAKKSHQWNEQFNEDYKKNFPELMTKSPAVVEKTVKNGEKNTIELQQFESLEKGDKKEMELKSGAEMKSTEKEKAETLRNTTIDIPEKETSGNLLFIYLCILAAGSALAVRFVKF